MRTVLSSLAFILIALSVAPAFAADKREAKPQFKGVELYSWKSDKGEWLFSLMPGTNRLKQPDEVKAKAKQIAGVAALKKAMGRLAVNEQVFWFHAIPGFVHPKKGTIGDIVKHAKTIKVKLHAPM